MSNPTATAAPSPDQLIERLRPRLNELEQLRQEIRQKKLRQCSAIAVLTVIVALAVAIAIGIGSTNSGIAVFALFGGAVWIGFVAVGGQKQWEHRAQRELVPLVAEAIDDRLNYQRSVAAREYVRPFEVLELVGQWNSGEVVHHFRGQHRARRFEMVHADLRSSGGRNSSSSEVFYGLLCRVQLPLNVDPGLSIRPNFGLFAKAFGKKAVATGNQTFDKTFLVSVENNSEHGAQVIARVLTPELQQALLTINEQEGRLAFDRPTFHAGFKYDSLYLALTREEEGRAFGAIRTERRRPFLDVGYYFTGESRLESGVKDMIDDIGTIYRIIDMLEPAL